MSYPAELAGTQVEPGRDHDGKTSKSLIFCAGVADRRRLRVTRITSKNKMSNVVEMYLLEM